MTFIIIVLLAFDFLLFLFMCVDLEEKLNMSNFKFVLDVKCMEIFEEYTQE